MGNSNQHQHYDVPHILVGGANGKLKGNRHLDYERKTVTTGNLLLSVLDMYGIDQGQAGRQHRPAAEAGLASAADAHDATSNRLRVCRARSLPRDGAGRCRAPGKSDVADAAMKGDAAAVRALLAAEGRRQRAAGRRRDRASLGGVPRRPEVADLLIRAGANVKAANREGVTPLAMASLYGNAAMIDRLLKAGADAKAAGPERRDDAHVRGAERQPAGHQGAGRGRRRRERDARRSAARRR